MVIDGTRCNALHHQNFQELIWCNSFGLAAQSCDDSMQSIAAALISNRIYVMERVAMHYRSPQ